MSGHFTWLADGDWPTRILSFSGWLLALAIARLPGHPRARNLATALLVACAIAFACSSVGEEWRLWVLPLAALQIHIGYAVSWPAICHHGADGARDFRPLPPH